MSWIKDEELQLNWFEKLVINLIKQGPIPKHCAVIMDGNRRWDTKKNQSGSEGYRVGFEKLSEALEWVGIQELTVYAFSIENFNRAKEEVDTLLDLAREKFGDILLEAEKFHRRGVRIRVIGNLDLLPKDLQKIVAEAMLLTQDNKKLILNVAFAYTSREEITNSFRTIVEGIENNELRACDITDRLIDECLYTNKCSDVDLLIRTSGEVRFSDFLLWQIPSTVFYFTETLWPDFTFWNYMAGILHYQRCYMQRKILMRHFVETRPAINVKNRRIKKFLAKLEAKRQAKLVELSKLVLD